MTSIVIRLLIAVVAFSVFLAYSATEYHLHYQATHIEHLQTIAGQ